MLKRLDGHRTAKHIRTRGALGLERAYELPSPDDGMRVLVDRLWPRGLNKEQLAVYLWLKDVARSDMLRRWYGHEPRRWRAFVQKYRAELVRRTELLLLLDELRRRGRVTLLYGARDAARNNAVVLHDVLEELRRNGRHMQKKHEPL